MPEPRPFSSPMDTDALMAALVADLVPTPGLAEGRAALTLGALALMIGGLALAILGLSPLLRAPFTAPMLVPVQTLLFGVAVASGWGAVASARPDQGPSIRRRQTLLAGLVLAGLLTLMAILAGLTLPDRHIGSGLVCTVCAAVIGLGVTLALVSWLRCGAPASLRDAATFAGLCGASFGMFVTGLHCAEPAAAHIGFWHTMPVVGLALMARYALPPLLRW